MSPKLASALMAAVVAAGFTAPAVADDNGLAVIHTFSREGGKLCFADHWHYASGSGPTKKAAQAETIRGWQDFTALEYGSDWARFSRAQNKVIRCSAGSGGAVDCNVEARPCK